MHANIRSALLAAALTAAAPPAFANVITDWDEKAVAVVTPMASLGGTSPYTAVRMMGMVHAAMFDAVNSIERRYRPYLVQLPAEPSHVEGSRRRGGSRRGPGDNRCKDSG